MGDIRTSIMAELASDPAIDARNIRLEDGGARLQRKRTLRVTGVVSDGAQKDRVLKTVQRHTGDAWVVLDHLYVSEILWEG